MTYRYLPAHSLNVRADENNNAWLGGTEKRTDEDEGRKGAIEKRADAEPDTVWVGKTEA